MNKKVLNIIIYTSVFSTAYAGFFYQKYSVAMNGRVLDHHLLASRPTAVINTKADVVANNETSSENNQSIAGVPLTTASTETSTIVSKPSVTFTKSFTESSDGSEFLPDGSSQQDLFNLQAKNPRTYTIKNYQQADISCAPGYGAPTAHAKLMRNLKGC